MPYFNQVYWLLNGKWMAGEFLYLLAKEDAERMYFNYPGMNTVLQTNYRKLHFFCWSQQFICCHIKLLKCSVVLCLVVLFFTKTSNTHRSHFNGINFFEIFYDIQLYLKLQWDFLAWFSFLQAFLRNFCCKFFTRYF